MTAGSLVYVAYAAGDPAGTALGTLTDASDKRVTVEADGIGAGSCSISALSSQAAWVQPGGYIGVWRDTVNGDPLAGFWMGEGSDVVVSDEEQSGEVLRPSGAGPIACLEDAVVWKRAYRGGRIARVQLRKGRWLFRRRQRFAVATVLVRMVSEAKARNCLSFVTLTFSASQDSDGNAWPDDLKVKRYAIPIGITFTELVTILRAKGMRVEMDASFRLNAWPDDRENDLSGSVTLAAGTDIRADVERAIRATRAKSHMLMGGERHRGGERFVAVSDSAILADLGRRKEGFRDVGRTMTKGALRRAGRRALRRLAAAKDGPASVPVIDTSGQVALVDYVPGDTVTLTIPGAYSGGQRIAAITLVETDSGEYDPVIEFGELLPDTVTGEDWTDDAATAARGN